MSLSSHIEKLDSRTRDFIFTKCTNKIVNAFAIIILKKVWKEREREPFVLIPRII